MPLYSVSTKNVDGIRIVKASTIAGARNHVAKDIVTAELLEAEAALALDPKLTIETASTDDGAAAKPVAKKAGGKKSAASENA